jgi:hypothetical protein
MLAREERSGGGLRDLDAYDTESEAVELIQSAILDFRCANESSSWLLFVCYHAVRLGSGFPKLALCSKRTIIQNEFTLSF